MRSPHASRHARQRHRARGGPTSRAAVVVALAVVLAACTGPTRPADTRVTAAPTGADAAAADRAVTLVAAGDVACAPSVAVTDGQCQQEATADLVEGLHPDSVLVLGDTAYEQVDAETLKGYDASWGRFLDRTHAVVGNHEYYGSGPEAYWGYFGDRAGPRDEGWYSYDVGAWHVVVLNSECDEIDCDEDGAQGRWLADDLATHPARCTLAAYHRPRFSSGEEYGDDESVSAIWRVLQDAGVDVVLNGHEHSYERFAPQRDSGRATAEEGMAEFVVGTGGRDLRGFGDVAPNSEVRWNESFGVLALTLRPDGYDWRFHATDGADVDAGSATCR
jgi:acid phosphatase type 7